MKLSQFSAVSGQQIRRHVLAPLSIVTALLFWGVGEIVSFEQPGLRVQASSNVRVAWNFYHLVYLRLRDSPQICQPAHKEFSQLNSFQARQCHDYMSSLYLDLSIGSVPIVVPLVLYILFSAWASWLYATAHRRIQSKHPKAIGILTEPMELPMDSFGWWGCLRPVMVQLKDKRQIKVYLSYSDQISAPGRRVAIFKLFPRGKSRYVAVPYLPELFVRG
ncbi:hypothetical protein EBS43_05920 [bacterium]|nr:hypothetical protein [bacterium]